MKLEVKAAALKAPFSHSLAGLFGRFEICHGAHCHHYGDHQALRQFERWKRHGPWGRAPSDVLQDRYAEPICHEARLVPGGMKCLPWFCLGAPGMCPPMVRHAAVGNLTACTAQAVLHILTCTSRMPQAV